MAGFDNEILYADNVDFTGANPAVGRMTAAGQLLIGAGSAPFLRANTLTAGTGIDINNGDGTITISTKGNLLKWNSTAAPSKVVWLSGEGWFSTNANFTIPLPVTTTVGDVIGLLGYNSFGNGQRWVITQAANQFINFGSLQTSVGVTGSLTAASDNACVIMVNVGINQWTVISSMGNITVA